MEIQKYTRQEIETLVNEYADNFKVEINDKGIFEMVEECLFYQEENNRDATDQLDYIFNQAIQDGCWNAYLI